jgi:hypothetical protein
MQYKNLKITKISRHSRPCEIPLGRAAPWLQDSPTEPATRNPVVYENFNLQSLLLLIALISKMSSKFVNLFQQGCVCAQGLRAVNQSSALTNYIAAMMEGPIAGHIVYFLSARFKFLKEIPVG